MQYNFKFHNFVYIFLKKKIKKFYINDDKSLSCFKKQ